MLQYVYLKHFSCCPYMPQGCTSTKSINNNFAQSRNVRPSTKNTRRISIKPSKTTITTIINKNPIHKISKIIEKEHKPDSK